MTEDIERPEQTTSEAANRLIEAWSCLDWAIRERGGDPEIVLRKLCEGRGEGELTTKVAGVVTGWCLTEERDAKDVAMSKDCPTSVKIRAIGEDTLEPKQLQELSRHRNLEVVKEVLRSCVRRLDAGLFALLIENAQGRLPKGEFQQLLVEEAQDTHLDFFMSCFLNDRVGRDYMEVLVGHFGYLASKLSGHPDDVARHFRAVLKRSCDGMNPITVEVIIDPPQWLGLVTHLAEEDKAPHRS